MYYHHRILGGGNHVIEKKVTQKNICHRKILVTKWQKFLPKFSITFRSLYDMVKNFYHMVKKILSHGKNKFLWVMDWSRYSSPPPCEFKITQESYMIYSNVNVYTSIWRKCFRAHFTGRFFQNKINYHFDFKNSWNYNVPMILKKIPPSWSWRNFWGHHWPQS